MQWISQHKLLFIAVVVVVAITIWFGLSQGTQAPPLLTSDAPTGSVAASAGGDQQLVATLLALRTVTLNATIFSDAAFKTLQDFSTTIVPEPVGRENPFAPLTSATSAPDSPQAVQLFTPKR